VKLTVDSNEPLEDAIRVVGALYGVTLVVAREGLEGMKPTQPSSSKPKKRSATTKPRRRAGVAAHAGSRKAQTTPAGSASTPSSADIRSWAQHTGLSVRGRGRVPASVLTAYQDAHK
jgi:hypothetical protein